jgi:hypothetical protein
MLQWYGNVPAEGKVCENVPLAAMFPESHTPVSEVAVCVTPAWTFDQVTLSPAVMFVVAGVKAKLLRVTFAAAAFAVRGPWPRPARMGAAVTTTVASRPVFWIAPIGFSSSKVARGGAVLRRSTEPVSPEDYRLANAAPRSLFPCTCP